MMFFSSSLHTGASEYTVGVLYHSSSIGINKHEDLVDVQMEAEILTLIWQSTSQL